jgi:hypothetical protein
MQNWMMGVPLLFAGIIAANAASQTQSATPTPERHIDLQTAQFRYEMRAARAEGIAMCHHAIRAAKHEAMAVEQNAYYRYILNAPRKENTKNVYPIPERCKNLETDWVLSYTNMGPEAKTTEEKTIRDEVGLAAPDISSDAQFLTVVLDKILIEGDDAVYWENRDKDIPKP